MTPMGPSSGQYLRVLHTLRIRGFADTPEVAESTGLSDDEAHAFLHASEQEGEVRYRDGRMVGWSLTPDGRAKGEELLSEELDSHGVRASVAEAYAKFRSVNAGFLALCTDWQLRPPDSPEQDPVFNDHSDPDYDAEVIARLADLDGHAQSICSDLADQLERFTEYGPRFTHALHRVQAGELDWFTKPMIESYHSVWFELHEDLLATLGIDRATESVPG